MIIKGIITSNVFWTVISGVLVFVFSQVFNEYCLKPIQKYKELRAKIAYSLTLYANLYMNPIVYNPLNESQKINDASSELRKLAAEVDAMIELKPRVCPLIADKKTLGEVSGNLVGISNGFYSPHPNIMMDHNEKYRNNIYKLLKMERK